MSLDEYVISQSTDELIAQLRQLGIKPLSDLSEEAQQLKHRIWERELSQQGRKTKNNSRIGTADKAEAQG